MTGACAGGPYAGAGAPYGPPSPVLGGAYDPNPASGLGRATAADINKGTTYDIIRKL